ncbi:MAG: protein arginine kinase [Limnochordia bacterium]|jgi:protein arginine kinase|nr:protein arginine kinase [Limnochordia bacterium]
MGLEDLLRSNMSYWMRGKGPANDIVLASRIRLARNIDGIPFPMVASDDELKRVEQLVKPVAEDGEGLGQCRFVALSEISPLQRQLLVERHLISPNHAENVKHKAVCLREDEAVSIMVNEEDHLRLQVIFPGLQLRAAWELCDDIDDHYESRLEYAFSDRVGYLTCCPTNVGTGMRASVMLHLPALGISNQSQGVLSAISQFGVAVRGLYGEGTQSSGNIYQISNRVTLGVTEEEIIQHLENITKQVIEQERSAREQLLKDAKLQLEDRVYRSLGILANARLINTTEALELLSDVRLGIDLKLVEQLEPAMLQELLVSIRPAHLQEIMGRDMDAHERDAYRAALVRERIRSSGKQNNN